MNFESIMGHNRQIQNEGRRDRSPSRRSAAADHRPGSSNRRGSNNRGAASGRGLPDRLPLSPDGSQPLPSVQMSTRWTHPNIFRKRLKNIQGNPQVGDWVAAYCSDEESDQAQLFAYGLFNPKSEVAVRLVRWSDELPNDQFWNELIERAVTLRTETLALDGVTDCYRVVHGEADGIPGLVIDRYGDCLSAEVFSIAIAPRVEELLERFARVLGTKHWLIQPSPHLMSQEGYELASRSSPDLPAHVVVQERGVRYRVHFGTGHKTGFFCDQRDNRFKLAEFCKGKSVLDLCCYTGGFSVMAAGLGQASEVTGVDLDEAPLETAKQNAALNNLRIRFAQADAFAYMRDMLRLGRMYDCVVLDPPKLIRNRNELEEGTRKHFDLNRLAMQLVKPGGLMLTCSCAGLLQEADFVRLVRSAARSAFQPTDFNPNPVPRQMQILARTGAATCHPVSANCPETEYLKAMWLRL